MHTWVSLETLSLLPIRDYTCILPFTLGINYSTYSLSRRFAITSWLLHKSLWIVQVILLTFHDSTISATQFGITYFSVLETSHSSSAYALQFITSFRLFAWVVGVVRPQQSHDEPPQLSSPSVDTRALRPMVRTRDAHFFSVVVIRWAGLADSTYCGVVYVMFFVLFSCGVMFYVRCFRCSFCFIFTGIAGLSFFLCSSTTSRRRSALITLLMFHGFCLTSSEHVSR